MSLIIRVLDAAYCSTTHHKLALDALDHLRAARGPAWRNFLVTHHRMYFEGARDPDKTFKDYTNHVLHVRDDYWGGAREQVRHWYGATVRALWRKEWSLAAYSAGVLSHYVTDPLMPFHTGQGRETQHIHRAVEWSIRQSYDDLRALAKSRMGYPHLEAGTHPGWLDELVTAGAEISNGYYEALIEHFNFSKSIRNPREGLDPAGREMIAQLLGFATISLARILDRAFVEAGVSPPVTHPTLEAIFSLLDIPIAWVTKNLSDARESALVESQYREWVATGQVERTLTPDLRQVREEAAKARAHLTAAPPQDPPNQTPPPTESSAPSPKAGLQLTDEVDRAPSIGPQTAECLHACGIRTIGDLLTSRPDDLANRLGGTSRSPSVVLDWQDQARLIMEIPELKAEQAGLLTGAGYRTAAALADAQPEELLQDVTHFLHGANGQRSPLHHYTPTLRDMATLIGWAEAACPLDARQKRPSAKVELPA